MLSEKLIKLVEARNFAFIATLGKDGYPTVTPVWIDHDGEHLLVNTTANRAKARRVRVNPKVSVAVVDWSNPYDKVVVKGRVVEVSDNGAEAHIDKLAKKYLGQDKYPWKNPSEKRVILKIKPEKVLD
ncbi:MAG: PPOX class F420-dependent oxidoreductase [Thermoprotei archaeon]